MLIREYIIYNLYKDRWISNFRIIVNDTFNNLITYQQIRLVVNECVNGQAIWNNPTYLSSSVSVLYCVCDELSIGIQMKKILIKLNIYIYRLFFYSRRLL